MSRPRSEPATNRPTAFDESVNALYSILFAQFGTIRDLKPAKTTQITQKNLIDLPYGLKNLLTLQCLTSNGIFYLNKPKLLDKVDLPYQKFPKTSFPSKSVFRVSNRIAIYSSRNVQYKNFHLKLYANVFPIGEQIQKIVQEHQPHQPIVLFVVKPASFGCASCLGG